MGSTLKPSAIAEMQAGATPVPSPPGSLDDMAARVQRVAAIAAAHADTVDRDARFPGEAMDAARAEGLLGVMVPEALGGEGAQLDDLVDACYVLGQSCAATAMIYAMHQATLACVVRHAGESAWHEAMLRRVAAEQLLLASSTTEGSAGGNVRSSEAPVERDADRISLTRAATVISYGEQADGVVTTARRAPDADPTDQSLVVLLRDDYTLERTMSWDTLGMRGTCSAGFTLRANAEAAQVMPAPYAVIHSQSMAPNAHLLWSGVWAGIAAGAVDRARRFMRKAARNSDGQLPPGAPHFTKATASLRALRALISASVQHYLAVKDDAAALTSVEYQTDLSLLKVDASELAVSTIMSALRACGLSGYRNDTDVSVGRMLRDALSAPIMINNDRILANVATSALVAAVPQSIRD